MNTEKNQETKMIEKISGQLQLPPDFPQKYEKAIIRSAEICAVTAHIQKAPSFEINVNIGG